MKIFKDMNLKYFKFFFLFTFAVVLTLGLSLSFQSLLAAWIAPTGNPPNNNADAPLNVGNTAQSKQGSLWINTFGAFDPGLWVTGNVGIGTITPVSKLQVQDGAVAFSGSTGATPISGAGTRLMWIPAKAAFRAGYVSSTQWNDGSIGQYSAAFGYNATASGQYSAAFGRFAEAIGNYSTAFGGTVKAIGLYSAAFNSGTTASAESSVAFGSGTTASGKAAAAFGGYSTEAKGEASAAFGYTTTASGQTAAAFGNTTTASGQSSVAFGENTTAQARDSMVIGQYNVIRGDRYSWIATDPLFIIGNGTMDTPANALTVLKNGKVGIGTANPASSLQVNPATNIEGVKIITSNYSPFVIRNSTDSADLFRIDQNGNMTGGSIGGWTRNAGSGYLYTTTLTDNVGIGIAAPLAKLQVQDGAVAFSGSTGATPISGAGTRLMWIPAKAAFRAGTVSGAQWNDANIGLGSAAFGNDTTASGQSSAAFGDNTTASGGNSAAFGGLSKAIGTNSTAFGLFTTASGLASAAFGQSTTASEQSSVAFGGNTTASGLASAAFGYYTTAGGDYSFAAGRNMQLSATADNTFVWGISAAAVNITTPDAFIIYSGNVGIGTNNPGTYKLNVQGTARIASDLTVEGKFNLAGADVAEEFSAPENYEAGTVLVMGDNGYRSARVSSKAYDTTVIGVVSDNPAIIMGKAAGENKAIVAIAGVIKVKVTDSNGKIMKGDLLTTSDLTGYAMKATENKLGTIIGKALEDLQGNRGEIMTLINLQ